MANSTALVYISFSHSTSLTWTEASWVDAVVRIPLDVEINTLTSHLGGLVRQRLCSDAVLSRKLRHANLRLVLHSSLSDPGCAWGPLNLDHDTRIEHVRDLFFHPDCNTEGARITISLKLEKTHCQSRLLRDSVRVPVQPPQPEFYRIGYASLPDDDYPEAVAKRKHGKTGPSYTWALVTWKDESTKKWKFRRTHAYDFDDYCIGNVNEHTRWNHFEWGNECQFLGPYEYVYDAHNSKTKLAKLLEELRGEGVASITPGVPLLPRYTFNKYDPAEHSMGLTEWPKRGIDVVVTCVNHLGGVYPELEKISFPRDIYIVVGQHDGPSEIETCICEAINTSGEDDEYRINSNMLFSRAYRSAWRMEVWAMPQLWEKFKLYRYTEGSLASFLDGSIRVRKTEKRIYVEAHFVPA